MSAHARTSLRSAQPIHIVVPGPEHGRIAHALAVRTGVLDVNSPYAYLLLFDRFRATCRLAFASDATPLGFVTGFRCPSHPEVAFLWQIGVDPAYHGRGVGAALLDAFVASEGARGASTLETHVSPSNASSLALFAAFARRRGVAMERRGGYPATWFPTSHEPEDLVRIALGSTA